MFVRILRKRPEAQDLLNPFYFEAVEDIFDNAYYITVKYARICL